MLRLSWRSNPKPDLNVPVNDYEGFPEALDGTILFQFAQLEQQLCLILTKWLSGSEYIFVRIIVFSGTFVANS